MNGNFRYQISDFRFQRSDAAASHICNLKSENCNRRRPAFTLTELMIVIAIMAILAGLGVSAMSGATNMAREHRAGAMIGKIDQLLMERYEGYRTRTVPVKMPAGTPPRLAAMIRLNALRDLMRMELPDRKSDVMDPPVDVAPDLPAQQLIYYTGQGSVPTGVRPSLQGAYLRIGQRTLLNNWPAGWTEQNQGSECLYLILSTMRDGDKSALDYFDATEIGDTDNDGMKEILDGWGTPIEFIRWPAGYAENVGPDGAWGRAGVDDDGDGIVDNVTEAGWPLTDDFVPDMTAPNYTGIVSVRTIQTKNYVRAPDPFDPVKVQAIDPMNQTTQAYLFGSPYTPGYNLHPLIVSAGPDKKFDIVFDQKDAGLNIGAQPYRYASQVQANNTYLTLNPFVAISVKVGAAATAVTVPIGTAADVDGDGFPGYADNITNHDRASEQ